MITKIKIICASCGKETEKKASEIKRQKNKGKTLFYCDLSCAGKANCSHLKPYQEQIKKYSGIKNFKQKRRFKQTDEYSPFRYHINNIRKRIQQNKKESDIDIHYLKKIWEEQNGLCAVTGLELQNKYLHNTLQKTAKNPYQASLDRIDNSKGYIKGNVRFVCLIFNYARNTFEDNDVIEFCKKVTDTTEILNKIT